MYHTGTGFPPCLPGLNAGSVLTTLMASLSSSGSTLLRISTLSTPPFEVTQNLTITFPWILFSFATSGYWVCSAMYAEVLLHRQGTWAFPQQPRMVQLHPHLPGPLQQQPATSSTTSVVLDFNLSLISSHKLY